MLQSACDVQMEESSHSEVPVGIVAAGLSVSEVVGVSVGDSMAANVGASVSLPGVMPPSETVGDVVWV